MQIVLGQQPNFFTCAHLVVLYIYLLHPHNTLRWILNVDLEFMWVLDSSSIIRYLEPWTGDFFKTHFEDCHFNKTIFPPLGEEKSLPKARHEITWNISTLSHLDPRTSQCELELQRTIHLLRIANYLPGVFIDNKKIVKSHIPTANTPTRIEVPVGK